MKMKNKSLTFCLIMNLLIGATIVQSQETNGRLTMQQAIDTALREHPSLKESRERVAAAQYQIGASRAAYLPQLSYTGNFLYGNAFPSGEGPTGGTPGVGAGSIGGKTTDFYTSRFSFTQLVYDFGKTPGQIDRSRATFHQTREDYSGNRQRVVLDARSAYYANLAAQRAVKVEQENVAQNQTLLKQAQGFYNVGLRAKIDVTKAEANLYDAEASLIRAKNFADLSRVTLMNALGLKTWPYKELEDVLDVTPTPLSLTELKAQALQQRPELLRNRYQQDSDQAALRVARAGYFPTFSTLAAYGWSSPNAPFSSGAFDNNSWWVGAGLTWPVFDGLLTYHNVRVARSNIQATLAGGEVLRQDVGKEVEQAYLDLKSGWELVRATKKALESARENFRLAQGRYQVGVGSIIEVTDAQVQLSRAELRQVQALYDYKVNEARLDKAIGKGF
ncbi:MAG: TolC family protein [Deltaproteobacteria bacterium]|nr:TolC family protein [Deltaproteobacteria bacterium]